MSSYDSDTDNHEPNNNGSDNDDEVRVTDSGDRLSFLPIPKVKKPEEVKKENEENFLKKVTPLSKITDLSKLDSKIKDTHLPRSFLLDDEIKNSKNYSQVPYGLAKNDIDMIDWSVTFITQNGDNIILASFQCDKDYPKTRPHIIFPPESLNAFKRVRGVCNADGTINESTLKTIPWTSETKIGDYLMLVRAKII